MSVGLGLGILFIGITLPAIPPVLWMIFVSGSIDTEGVIGVIRAIVVLSFLSVLIAGSILESKSAFITYVAVRVLYTYRVGIVGWITKVAGIQVESEISMYLILLAILVFQWEFITLINKYGDT